MEQLVSSLSHNPVDSPRVIHTVVIFINSGSGGRQSHQLLDTTNQGKQLNQIFSTYLYIFKICDQSSRKMGLDFVNTLVKETDFSLNKIVVMAGGGDGTVNWLLTEILAAKIDFTKIAFGALPLGTGNDFAKNLGWTKVTLFNGYQGIKQFFTEIKQSTFEEFDVWEVQVQHQQEGSIVQIQDGEQKKVNNPLVKQVTNYFSFGMDARVGYHFDKKRSNFQFLNLLIYCMIGCFNRCKKIPSVEKVVANMKQNDQDDEMMDLIFSSDADRLHLRHFRNILALNINSYMGGVKDVWKNSQESGLKNKPFTPSSHSDGKLQFLAFKNEWELGFQRVFSGRARKISQGSGQFKLEFDKNCMFTYLNFDGEYFKIYKPKVVIIRKSPHFQHQKLRVIRCSNR